MLAVSALEPADPKNMKEADNGNLKKYILTSIHIFIQCISWASAWILIDQFSGIYKCIRNDRNTMLFLPHNTKEQHIKY